MMRLEMITMCRLKCLNDQENDPVKCAPEQMRECNRDAETHMQLQMGF